MQIIPIASGKGGVGKSLVATNLSIALAEAGKDVILADLDLGASNLHLMLGMAGLRQGIGTYLTSGDMEFEEIVVDTPYDHLRFIPGDAEIPGMANLKPAHKTKLIRRLHDLHADFLILDLGAGSSYNTMDFFLSSSNGIIVTAPSLTATLNAYLFLKNAVFRILDTSFRGQSPGKKRLDELKADSVNLQKVYVPKLLESLRNEDPKGYDVYASKMDKFHPGLVMNMLEDPKDGQKASKIRRSCREYLDIDMEHLGIIYRDHLQDIALGSRMPIVVYKPNSVLSQAIYRIADKLLGRGEEMDGPLDIQSLEDSYQEAEMAAEIDFEAKIHEMENLLHSGVLSKGDLVDTIRSQQYEISVLKKENALLRDRLLKATDAGFRV